MRAADAGSAKRAKYHTTEMSRETREAIARIFSLLVADGMPEKKCLEYIHRAGYPVPPQTFSQWITAVKSTGSALSASMPHGRESALDDEKKKIFAGWVLHRVDMHRPVQLKHARAMISKRFGIDLTEATAGNYLRELGFSCREVRSRPKGYDVSYPFLLSTAQTWLSSLHVDSVPRRIVCFDATATSHRRDRELSFQPRGTPQLAHPTTIPSYTNQIFEGLWADGLNRTPALLFTHNPKFDLSRRGRSKHSSEQQHFLQVLAAHGIDQSRIIYERSDKHYYAESADMVRVFLGRYSAEFGDFSTITSFSDDGRAYKVGEGRTVFDEAGVRKHCVFPPIVHHYLSPNDADLHPAVKSAWRSACPSFDDDVLCSVKLLALIDQYSVESRSWFANRLLIKGSQVTSEKVGELIPDPSRGRSEFHTQCLYAYHVFRGKHRVLGIPFEEAPSDRQLDGPYFER